MRVLVRSASGHGSIRLSHASRVRRQARCDGIDCLTYTPTPVSQIEPLTPAAGLASVHHTIFIVPLQGGAGIATQTPRCLVATKSLFTTGRSAMMACAGSSSSSGETSEGRGGAAVRGSLLSAQRVRRALDPQVNRSSLTSLSQSRRSSTFGFDDNTSIQSRVFRLPRCPLASTTV